MQTLLKMQKDTEHVHNAPKSRKECGNRINACSSNIELNAGVIRRDCQLLIQQQFKWICIIF